ncbi:MAG: hypothetical protein ACREQ1_03590, partial [Woeseiaceae bacterium]
MARNSIRLLRMSFIVSLALLFAGCGQDSQQPADDAPNAEAQSNAADLVLRGGKVATVDPALGTQQAIAISGFEITAVGSNEAIEAHIGPDTRVVE